MMANEVVYGRTNVGQFIYDLAFAKLSDRWLARKHRQPIAVIRSTRARLLDALKPPKKSRKRSAG